MLRTRQQAGIHTNVTTSNFSQITKMTASTTKRPASTAGRLQKELRQTKPFSGLQEEAFLNLVRTADQLQHALRVQMKPYGITETQYNSLRILRGAGKQGLTCSEISERLISHDPDITRLLGRMERQGLVRRERDNKDRRVVVTRITPEGLARLKELDRVVANKVKSLLAHMAKEDLNTLVALLERARCSGTA